MIHHNIPLVSLSLFPPYPFIITQGHRPHFRRHLLSLRQSSSAEERPAFGTNHEVAINDAIMMCVYIYGQIIMTSLRPHWNHGE